MSILDDLRAERAKYGATMTDDECVELINAVAWANRADGWGLNSKTGGTRGRRYDGAEVAHDVLHNQRTNILYDVLVAAGGHSTPTWNELGPNGNSSRPWVAPIAPQGEEPEPVDPDPPPVDLSAVVAALAALGQELAAHRAMLEAIPALAAGERERIEAVVKDVAARLDRIAFPSYSGRILGQRFTLTPDAPREAMAAAIEAPEASLSDEDVAALVEVIRLVLAFARVRREA